MANSTNGSGVDVNGRQCGWMVRHPTWGRRLYNKYDMVKDEENKDTSVRSVCPHFLLLWLCHFYFILLLYIIDVVLGQLVLSKGKG